MKKYLVVIMAVLMALCLCACGKSEAVKAAEEKIAAIGEVTLDSEKRISAAEKAVEKLSDDELKQLDKAEELKKAREKYERLVESKAAVVDSLIVQIGEVTIESEEKIEAARQEYDAVPASVKSRVKGLTELESAENMLIMLRAQRVDNLIDQIGEVTLESADKINAAQQAFNRLKKNEKAQVKNVSRLTRAREEFAALQKQEKEAKRTEALKLLGNMRLDEDKVRHLKFYYPSIWRVNQNETWIADKRCFILPYIGMDDHGGVWMRVVYNFTNDDWVFFKKITVAADEKRYYRSFEDYDIVHDVDGGVREYIDIDGVSDVEMLLAIANSKETIVRFEGDEFVYDFIVKEIDKRAIREVLLVYETFRYGSITFPNKLHR